MNACKKKSQTGIIYVKDIEHIKILFDVHLKRKFQAKHIFYLNLFYKRVI